MTRLVRFSSAALGMVLLAGLASYQGRVELGQGEEDILTGTVLVETADMNESDCEGMAVPDGDDADDCTEKELLSANN